MRRWISTVRPLCFPRAASRPIRSGEALRALMFFKVMAEVTGDQAIEDYYRNELIGNRQFLQVIQDYGTIADDIDWNWWNH